MQTFTFLHSENISQANQLVIRVAFIFNENGSYDNFQKQISIFTLMSLDRDHRVMNFLNGSNKAGLFNQVPMQTSYLHR